MEIRNWSYEEYPSFDEPVEGVVHLPTTGDEAGTYTWTNVPYATVDGTTLHLQIIIPASRNRNNADLKYPCLVYVQGSAWFAQNLCAKIGMLARFAEKGYVVAIVEYRHSGIAPFPSMPLDTRNAIRFMKLHAAEYKVDQNRVYVGGDSSGGHAAMFSQIFTDDADTDLYHGVSADVRGIISFYGASSMMLDDGMPSTPNHHLPDSPEGKAMGSVNLREHPELCEYMSVECNVHADTPLPKVLMFHGSKDRTINPRVSVVIYQKLKSLGKDVQLYILDGADHGGPEFWDDQIITIIEAFMQ